MRRALFFAAWLLLDRSAFAQSSSDSGMKEADHLRNVRYCEIFVGTHHGFSASAAVYNTLGLNHCPEEQWRALNVSTLQKESGASRIVLNAPRYFVMDKIALRTLGPERDFDGLTTRLVAEIEVKPGRKNRVPYVEAAVQRQSCYTYEAGKNVYELDSADGRCYIMQSYSHEVDPHLSEAGLSDLASRLSLPKGWRYEVRKLSAGLILCNTGDKAQVLQDNFNNTYQLRNP